MKWTMSKIKKMSREELIERIDRAEGMKTVWTGASKQELVNRFVYLLNKGLI